MTPRRIAPLLLAVAVAWGGAQALQAWHAQSLGRTVSQAAAPGDIVMLSSETCVFCGEARRWFQAHGVAFSECDIERDAACAAAYRALQAPGTPVLVVRGRRIVGFDPARIASALGASPPG
jgi:glutaredoxin